MSNLPPVEGEPDPNETFLRALPYQYSWTFDVEHIIELYQVCRVHPGATALEIGSYRGHCALAMALAGLHVASIDVSAKHLETRQQLIDDHRQNQYVTFEIKSSDDELELPRTFDVILHDNAKRGSSLVHELDAYWKRKLNPGGMMIVHNVEQIDLPRLQRLLNPEAQIVTTDRRKRQLGFFVKPGKR